MDNDEEKRNIKFTIDGVDVSAYVTRCDWNAQEIDTSAEEKTIEVPKSIQIRFVSKIVDAAPVLRLWLHWARRYFLDRFSEN